MPREVKHNGSQADINEEVVRVFPSDNGWCVQTANGNESIHNRKALAALFAKQIAANAEKAGRVIFYKADGSVEAMCAYDSPIHSGSDKKRPDWWTSNGKIQNTSH